MFRIIEQFHSSHVFSISVKLNLCTEKPQPKYSTETHFNSRIQILQLNTSISSTLFIPGNIWSVENFSIHESHRSLKGAECPCERRIKAEDEYTGS